MIDPPEMRGSRYRYTLLILIAVAFTAFLLSLAVGRYPIPVGTVFSTLLLGGGATTGIRTVLFRIRLPRIAAAMLVGAALSTSGATFQGLFKNPLVSSYILGVSSGAGLGAATAILLGGGPAVVQASAFAVGILAVAMTYGFSRAYRGTSTLTMVLSGIIVSSFFSALISLMKYLADPRDKLPAIVFWLMGSLAAVSRKDALLAAPPILLGILGLLVIRWRINVLSMGEEEAKSLGVDLKRVVGIIVVCSTVATASAVSISGVIGWIGLVMPHIGRMLVGPDYRKLIPASALIGASYLLVMDDLARTLTMGEIPLGILTALVGTPFFAYLLWRRKVGWT